ncbi:MAG: hypothetical protein V4530_01875 [Pseudomonadota bacterium]
MRQIDRHYYEVRLEQESARAKKSADRAAAHAHLELAQHYRALLEQNASRAELNFVAG